MDTLREEIAKLSASGRDLEAATECIKLGKVYMKAVQFEDALDIFDKALQLRLPHLGDVHPDTAHAQV